MDSYTLAQMFSSTEIIKSKQKKFSLIDYIKKCFLDKLDGRSTRHISK